MKLAKAHVSEQCDALHVTDETPISTRHLYCLSVTLHHGRQCDHPAFKCLQPKKPFHTLMQVNAIGPMHMEHDHVRLEVTGCPGTYCHSVLLCQNLCHAGLCCCLPTCHVFMCTDGRVCRQQTSACNSHPAVSFSAVQANMRHSCVWLLEY